MSKENSFIKNYFGSKRGLVRSATHYTKYLSGCYKGYVTPNIHDVTRIIFICSGNICRSPLAKVVAENLSIDTDSYGLNCRGGDPADPRASAYAKQLGLSLDAHITKNISDYIPEDGDLLVGMEPKHAVSLKSILGREVNVTLAGLWLPRPTPYLHDPFNTNQKFFTRCESLVEKSTQLLVQRITSNHA